MTVLKWLAALALMAWCGGLALLYLAQRSILFPIPETRRTSPQAAGLPQAEEHLLQTGDGEQLVAWHVPPQVGKMVVIFLHGNGDILAWRAPWFAKLVADGTGLVAVSFRGYAGSSGSPSEAGLLQDAEAAYAFAAQRYATGRIASWGYSLGTGPAVALASRHRIAALILEAPYTSIADVAAAAFPFAPVRWFVRDPFHSDRWIADVTSPVLIMHGERDLTIPIRFGEKLYEFAHQPKQMVRFAEAAHDDLDSFGTMDVARAFLAGTADQGLSK
ncbi:alpha/beta hydrolase [uncultured Bradyrhizobium sp.]|uniref:alpha/beta hydrolase n=1 Tax=uncultured Bradyrhizobium sp. TaxID=199684 RepID=UPI0035CCA547